MSARPILNSNGDDVRDYAGFVSAHRARQTGTLVVVIDDRTGTWSNDSLDDFGDGTSPWWTLCEQHGTMVQHHTRATALRHAADPLGWCEGCGAEIDGADTGWGAA